MDSMDLTNATSVEDVHTKRFNANEITVLKKDGVEQNVKDDKVTFGNSIFRSLRKILLNQLMVER